MNNFDQIPVFDSDPYDYGTPLGADRRRTAGARREPEGLSESERVPLGAIIPAVAKGMEIPPEPPDVGARALLVASRLLCGATVFFFLAFAFAYFYLRSLNADGMWRPAHVHPSKGLGTAFIALHRSSARPSSIVANRQMKRESPGWVAAAFGGIAPWPDRGRPAVHRVHDPALRTDERRRTRASSARGRPST